MPLPALPLPRRRPPARAVAACACVLALLGGAWLWLRDSGLVAGGDVSVTRLSGAEGPRGRAALEGAARDMTTLHVRPDQLRTAVEPYPSIMAVAARADFPHRLRIVVHEHVAVAALASGSDRVPVAADGTLLRGSSTSGLPLVAVAAAPAGGPAPGARARSPRRRHALGQARAARRDAAGRRAARAAGQGQPGLRRAPRPDGAAGGRPRPLLRRGRPPAGEVDGGRPGARRPRIGGSHL